MDVLLDALLASHGELMTSEALRKALGFRSERSFLRAAQCGALPVSVFSLPGHRGRYARTRDVALWLSKLGNLPVKVLCNADPPDQNEMTKTES